MIQEFIDRTGYEPSYDEYRLIEDSYYEYDGNKDDFCKQWKKDKKSGNWEKELKLRMKLEEQKHEYEEKIKEIETYRDFYRTYFYEVKVLKMKIEKMQFENNELKKENERNYSFMFDMVA